MQYTPFIDYVELLPERIENRKVYPFTIPALKDLDRLPLDPHVTFFVGENGSGKSTLLEAIAVAYGFNPEGGTRNFNFATRESHSELYQCIRLVRGPRRIKRSDGFFYRAESFFNVASQIDQMGFIGPDEVYGEISLHEQSHGESFMTLLFNRLGGDGLYILDEPESALSPQRQLALLAAMHELSNEGSQFIIATHSPIIMGYPDAKILHFDSSGIHPTEYIDTEPYKVTKAFLNRREKMLLDLGISVKSEEN